MHLVLARPEGVEGVGGPGTKGLSLFWMPEHHFDHATGELTGERNGVYVTNVEHKMGIKVSNTCEVTFGDPQVGGGEAAQGLAPRRGPQRHRPDVRRDRERPDDGRHQGHRHAVDRLPQRARLRQGARPGRRPHAGRGQDRPARDHHPPPRRTPLADDAEVVRRGHAGAGALHRHVAGPGHDRRAQRRDRRRSPPRSTTCCSRSSRATARSARGSCSAPSRCRPSAARASCRSTRSSSTSATPRSTPSTKAPPPSRARTSSSARSSRTRAARWVTWRRRSRASSPPRPATVASRTSVRCSRPRSRTPTPSSGT